MCVPRAALAGSLREEQQCRAEGPEGGPRGRARRGQGTASAKARGRGQCGLFEGRTDDRHLDLGAPSWRRTVERGELQEQDLRLHGHDRESGYYLKLEAKN